jgi:hypothetical protein
VSSRFLTSLIKALKLLSFLLRSNISFFWHVQRIFKNTRKERESAMEGVRFGEPQVVARAGAGGQVVGFCMGPGPAQVMSIVSALCHLQAYIKTPPHTMQ